MENLTMIVTLSLILSGFAVLAVGAVVAMRHAAGSRLEGDLAIAGTTAVTVLPRDRQLHQGRSIAA